MLASFDLADQLTQPNWPSTCCFGHNGRPALPRSTPPGSDSRPPGCVAPRDTTGFVADGPDCRGRLHDHEVLAGQVQMRREGCELDRGGAAAAVDIIRYMRGVGVVDDPAVRGFRSRGERRGGKLAV